MINKVTLNSLVIFGCIPMLLYSGFSMAAYFILFFYLIPNLNFQNVSLLVLASLLCMIYFYKGPLSNQPWETEQLAAINTTFAFFLLLLSPWIKTSILIEESIVTDVAVIIFLAVSLALAFLGKYPGAAIQIGSFTWALYFAISNKIPRKVFLALAIVIGGGRSIILGGLYGLVMSRWPKLHKHVSFSFLVVVSAMAILGFLFFYLQEYLHYLRGQGIFMKGRTGFWLSMLDVKSTMLGHGAGESVKTMMVLTDTFRLPHNDYLRVYVDYGLVLFVFFLFSLWKNSLRGVNQLIATSILVFYMLTGNPLSFSTVIVSYILILNCQLITRHHAPKVQKIRGSIL